MPILSWEFTHEMIREIERRTRKHDDYVINNNCTNTIYWNPNKHRDGHAGEVVFEHILSKIKLRKFHKSPEWPDRYDFLAEDQNDIMRRVDVKTTTSSFKNLALNDYQLEKAKRDEIESLELIYVDKELKYWEYWGGAPPEKVNIPKGGFLDRNGKPYNLNICPKIFLKDF